MGEGAGNLDRRLFDSVSDILLVVELLLYELRQLIPDSRLTRNLDRFKLLVHMEV